MGPRLNVDEWGGQAEEGLEKGFWEGHWHGHVKRPETKEMKAEERKSPFTCQPSHYYGKESLERAAPATKRDKSGPVTRSVSYEESPDTQTVPFSKSSL